MGRKHHKPLTGSIIYNKTPQRGEIWLVVDRDKKHDGKEADRKYESSVQGGTRLCIIVSNDSNNQQAPTVEVVYTTTKQKHNLPTHFPVETTPEPSIVLCEQVTTVAKKDLTLFYGTLTMKEKCQLDRCLKISLGLKPLTGKITCNAPKRGEIWHVVDKDKVTRSCIIVSNDLGNQHAPVVEVVYIDAGEKPSLPAHFLIETGSEASLVHCERIMTVAKKDLTLCHGSLTMKEKCQLDKCLKASLGL